MLRAKSCCCGWFTLTQGIIGTSILSTLEAAVYLVVGVLFVKGKIDTIHETHFKIVDSHKLFVDVMGITALVAGSVQLVASAGLFFGLTKKKRLLMSLWIAMRMFLCFFQVYAWIIIYVLGINFLFILLNIAWTFFMWYLAIVVNSYLKPVTKLVYTPGQPMILPRAGSFQLVSGNPDEPIYGQECVPPTYNTSKMQIPEPACAPQQPS